MNLKLFSLLALLIFTLNSCAKVLKIDDDGTLVPLTVMEDHTLPSIQVNGVNLHSETYGNPGDPMMIVIHGGPGADYRGMLNFKDLEKEGMYVVFYDQRGTGLSQRLDKSEFSEVQFFIDELDAVINYYRNSSSQKIVLAGHSWGAMLATAYINQNPDEISGLILAEPGGFTWEQTEEYISKSRKLELFAELTNDFVYQDQFITGSDHNSLDYKMVLSTAGNVTTGDLESAPYWRYGAVSNIASIELAINNPEQMDFTTNLDAYQNKVLFVYSEKNTAYGADHARAVSAALPNVELKEVLGCGHEMPSFGWDNLYPFITKYLNEIL